MSAAAKKHYEAGLKLIKSGKLDLAEAEIAEAIGLDEQQAEYWLKLGYIWTKQARHAEAKDAHQMAATLAPANSEALLNLGLSFIHLGEPDAGLPWIEKSFMANPTKKMAEDLGDAFATRGDYRLAAYYYLKGRKIDGSDPSLQAKLAHILYSDGDTFGAMVLYIDLVVRYPSNPHYINSLTDIYRKVDHTSFDERAYQALMICLKTENVKHRYLAPAWTSLFLLNPKMDPLRTIANGKTESKNLIEMAPLLGDEYINLGLKNLPLLNVQAEQIFEGIRRYFLLHHADADQWPKEALPFLASLAVQCWSNDFVFYETAEEVAALEKLTQATKDIIAADKEGDLPEALLLCLFACYRPLYTITRPGVKLPLAKSRLYEMRPLLKAQIQNPEREHALIATIPDFTEITDETSRAVQAMYAQRPYPRWKSTNMEPIRGEVADLSRGLAILIAGCGTGQEPSIYANSTPHARITAIDLSLPSIAYGKRMAEEIGYANKIDFMHGDLMEVGKIGRTFDLVVSSGVLHHMKEPEKGFAAILNTLKPGGRMNISLYSQIARDLNLGPASEYIKKKGYTSSDADIRQFRHEVMQMPVDDPIRRCVRASDFFMMAECNDLLFHVQEHRFTCLTLKALTEKLGLELFHVYMQPKYAKAWKEKHPDNPKFDFDRLHVFEQENPDLFLEMYKMYFHRKGEGATHILDPMIKAGLA